MLLDTLQNKHKSFRRYKLDSRSVKNIQIQKNCYKNEWSVMEYIENGVRRISRRNKGIQLKRILLVWFQRVSTCGCTLCYHDVYDDHIDDDDDDYGNHDGEE